MCGIQRNKETFSVGEVEHSHAGGKRWGLVFYGVKTNIMFYYRLVSKYPTDH